VKSTIIPFRNNIPLPLTSSHLNCWKNSLCVERFHVDRLPDEKKTALESTAHIPEIEISIRPRFRATQDEIFSHPYPDGTVYKFGSKYAGT